MPAPKDPVKYEEYCKKIGEAGKGRIPWNKGKSHTEIAIQRMSKSHKNISDETRQKMRESHIGHILTEDHKRKIGLAGLGRHHTEDSKRKISETRKRKGVVISEKQRELAREYGKSHPPSKETREKLRLIFKGRPSPMKGKIRSEESKAKIRGEKHPFWKGGISCLPYCFKFNLMRREAVRIFFGYLCLCCGKHVTENIIRWRNGFKQVDHNVHHIDHDKEQGCNGKLFNLIILCHECHGKENHHEQEFKDYINKTLKEGFKWGIWSKECYEKEVMYPE
jgi:5-methylcytosine-specific restriction endonuclease McrA